MEPGMIRGLYLGVGVDDKGAIATLQAVRDLSLLTERAMLGVAKASGSISAAAAGVVAANRRQADSYNALAASAARAGTAMRFSAGQAALQSRQLMNEMVSRGFPVGGQSAIFPPGMAHLARQADEQRMASRTPWSPRDFMSGITAPAGRGPYMPGYPPGGARRTGRYYGLGTDLFLASAGVGVGAYGFRQSAGFERASERAAFASGQSESAMRTQTLRTAREFSLRLGAASSLTQEIAQLGDLTPEGQRQIARAAAGFNVVEAEVSADDAAQAIYGLIKATSRSKEEFNQGTEAAVRYAGAIYAAGNESAAGAKEVFAMVREIEPLAQIMRLGANGTIALSAAFADLNANQRELFRGALTRMAVEGKIDPNNPVQSLLTIAERLRAAGDDAERINILKSLGFDNIRDQQTLAVMSASLDTFARSLSAVNQELSGTSTFGEKVNKLLGDQQGLWDALTGSTDRSAKSIMTGIAPALAIVFSTLTGIADLVADNPAIATLFGVGAAYFAGRAVTGFVSRRFGTDEATRLAALGLSGPRGALRRGRLADNLLTALPFLGSSRAESFAGTRLGMSLAEGSGLARATGAGRMSGLTLGLMRMLPFAGESLAVGTAGRMAAGGLAGGALRLATGPIGWVITALTLGAPIFERIGNAFSSMASKGGAFGVVLNTVSLIFEVLAAGGRILNKVFGWLGTAGKWVLNLVTAGHADDILGGVNAGLQGLQTGVRSIASDGTPGQPAKAPPGSTVNIYTDGSRSGAQMAIDEVGRRSARTMTHDYGGIPVA